MVRDFRRLGGVAGRGTLYGGGVKVNAEYVSRLYRAVKKDFPEFKFIFCPPFYWGPDSKAHYPEDRETYLKSLGEHLDPEIPAYWTGPMVKGYDKTREQVKWWVDLTRHQPAIFQNGCGAHNLINYGVDPTPWNVWHYKGSSDAPRTDYGIQRIEIPFESMVRYSGFSVGKCSFVG